MAKIIPHWVCMDPEFIIFIPSELTVFIKIFIFIYSNLCRTYLFKLQNIVYCHKNTKSDIKKF